MAIRIINPMLFVMLLTLIMLALWFVWHDFRQPLKKKKQQQDKTPTDAGLRDLILNGQLEEAVTVYQKFTGVDSFTAQKAIEQLGRELRLSDNMRQKVGKLLKRDNKAAAIEAYQQATGADLAEALEYVESL